MLVDEGPGGELLEVDILTQITVFLLILTNLTEVPAGWLTLFQLYCTAFNLLMQF